MEKLNPYLTFPGNCEEAFNFYRSVFGGEFLNIGRFSDIPTNDEVLIPEYKLNKIMHISLPIGKEVVLMGSDAGEEWSPGEKIGNNISLSVSASSKEQADHYFEALSQNGTIVMQIGDVFWGSYYGVCTDQFGVNWMISYTPKDTD